MADDRGIVTGSGQRVLRDSRDPDHGVGRRNLVEETLESWRVRRMGGLSGSSFASTQPRNGKEAVMSTQEGKAVLLRFLDAPEFRALFLREIGWALKGCCDHQPSNEELV